MNSQVNHRLRLGSSRRRSLVLVHLLPSAGRAFDIGSHRAGLPPPGDDEATNIPRWAHE